VTRTVHSLDCVSIACRIQAKPSSRETTCRDFLVDDPGPFFIGILVVMPMDEGADMVILQDLAERLASPERYIPM
jgi:hypothetical protein